VFQVDKGIGLTMTEIAPGVTLEEVRSRTGAPFKAADNLVVMEY
jgi:3-oxoacid CoA-transferase